MLQKGMATCKASQRNFSPFAPRHIFTLPRIRKRREEKRIIGEKLCVLSTFKYMTRPPLPFIVIHHDK